MINYIQQLLPRIRQFNSQLGKKELFVDKLFTLLQPNHEVHQYTFNRDNRLFLAVNGKTTEGSWELLNTGQLLIKRSESDIITLDFDFLHPDVMIMKLGGTSKDPFIIYRADVIEDANVYKFLKYFEAEKTGDRLYELPNKLLTSSDLNSLICDENELPYTGTIFSNPYDFYIYSPQKVRNVKFIKDGNKVDELFEVRYVYHGLILVIWQKNLYNIELGDRLVAFEHNLNTPIKQREFYLVIHRITIKIDEDNVITTIKVDNLLRNFGIFAVLIVATIIGISIYLNSQSNQTQSAEVYADTVSVEIDTTMSVGDTLQ
jgi:hypothetical protein